MARVLLPKGGRARLASCAARGRRPRDPSHGVRPAGELKVDDNAAVQLSAALCSVCRPGARSGSAASGAANPRCDGAKALLSLGCSPGLNGADRRSIGSCLLRWGLRRSPAVVHAGTGRGPIHADGVRCVPVTVTSKQPLMRVRSPGGMQGAQVRRQRGAAALDGEGACRTLFSHAGVLPELLSPGGLPGLHARLASVVNGPGEHVAAAADRGLFGDSGPFWTRVFSQSGAARRAPACGKRAESVRKPCQFRAEFVRERCWTSGWNAPGSIVRQSWGTCLQPAWWAVLRCA